MVSRFFIRVTCWWIDQKMYFFIMPLGQIKKLLPVPSAVGLTYDVKHLHFKWICISTCHPYNFLSSHLPWKQFVIRRPLNGKHIIFLKGHSHPQPSHSSYKQNGLIWYRVWCIWAVREDSLWTGTGTVTYKAWKYKDRLQVWGFNAG